MADAPSEERWHWKGPTVVLGLITLLVTALALGRDLFDFTVENGSSASPTTATTAATTPATSPPTTSSPPAPTADELQLISLEPASGGAAIRIKSGSSFEMACATNSGTDLYRAVQFEVPTGYTGFRGHIAPTGIVGIAQVDVRGADVTLQKVTLGPGKPDVDVSSAVASRSKLELRITCARPGGALTFSDAVLTK